MPETTRTVRSEEWDRFMRLLEESYGLSIGHFPRNQPNLYRADDDALSNFHVIEKDGVLVSHVGVFPLETRIFGSSLTIGGIGGVCTHPDYRGRKYMSTLLRHAIQFMTEKRWPLSVLWGDRQRYQEFGWDLAGELCSLTITKRSLDRAHITPAEMKEVTVDEAIPEIERLHATLPIRTERRNHALSLRGEGVRLWLGEDGYVISVGEGRQSPKILEIVSSGEKEAELTSSLMTCCQTDSVSCLLSPFDTGRFARLARAASYWQMESDGMYLIMDITSLLTAFRNLLSERARALSLSDFEVSVGLRLGDCVDAVTITINDGDVQLASGAHSSNYIEVDEREGVRLLLGGPSSFREKVGELSALLPLPVHIPPADRV